MNNAVTFIYLDCHLNYSHIIGEFCITQV